LQDETGGFTAFICWTFQPEHTEMADIPAAGSFEYLKTQAISRLYLDNFPNIQSSWVTQGLKMGQLALLYGANDMGSLMIEENVVAEAGTVHYLTLDEIRDAIEELGYTPRQRNVHYQLFDLDHEQRAIQANRERDATIRSAVPVIHAPSSEMHSRQATTSPADGSIMASAVPFIPLSIVSGDGTA
jgi:cyclic dehypoxanthinyl futalosine synthase